MTDIAQRRFSADGRMVVIDNLRIANARREVLEFSACILLLLDLFCAVVL